MKQKDIIEVEDASDAVQFYNVILQQLEEIVVVTKDPRELVIEEIIKILNGSKYQFEFIELMRDVCNRNEFVSRYFGNDFHVDTNKKLRMLRDRFVKGGVDNRILIVSLSPLVLAWKSSYDSDDKAKAKAKDDSKTDILTDQTDQTDQTDLPLFDRSHENNVISDDNSSSKIDSNIHDTDKNDDNNDDPLKKAQVSQVSQVSQTGTSENTTSRKFKCFYCDFYLSNDDERVNHIKSDHNGKLSWPTQEDFKNRMER